MAIYSLYAEIINRSHRAVANYVSYICGKNLHDNYNGKNYYHKRTDVAYSKIYLPDNAPSCFMDEQTLCDKINDAEKRRDSSTARTFRGALPNELPMSELIKIVDEFVNANFIAHGLCAIAAIHNKLNSLFPTRNNPHVHIMVTTRTVDSNGFSKHKYREHNKRNYIYLWREQWANIQNEAYARNGLDIRVSHKSFLDQGIDRKPTKHLSLADWQRELRGERTVAGNYNRSIKLYNQEQERQRNLERQNQLERECEIELFR